MAGAARSPPLFLSTDKVSSDKPPGTVATMFQRKPSKIGAATRDVWIAIIIRQNSMTGTGEKPTIDRAR
ncbi:MAG TPA: hypothetical protein VKI44_35030 [Acetobacteraceae bacterium]|nr:hypothetical protein [Acetobacteraceae bacterium]